jgi:hypothetical protein
MVTERGSGGEDPPRTTRMILYGSNGEPLKTVDVTEGIADHDDDEDES